jgi:small conductance mechanosensitive channel
VESNYLVVQTLLGYEYKDIFQYLSKVGLNLMLAALILVIGFWLAKRISRLIGKVLRKSSTDEGLVTFLINLSSITTKILVVLTAMSQLGMAFSGTLSNFAGGILILVFKPFRVGDSITALTYAGNVTEIQIFNTYILTQDGKTVILPNGPLINNTIVNVSKLEKRRIDIVLPIKYGEDAQQVLLLVSDTIKQNKAILKEPEPAYFFTDFEANAGKLTVTCWVKNKDYNEVHRNLSNAFFPWLKPTEA